MTRHPAAIAVLSSLCVLASPYASLAQQQGAAQDDADVKAYVLNETKFQELTASYSDGAACRKQNSAAWQKMVDDPAYADATLTQQAKLLESNVPQCAAIAKKHGMDTHEYLVAVEALHDASLVVEMKKRGMAPQAAKAAEAVNPATASFVESHYDEIQKWRQSLAAEQQK